MNRTFRISAVVFDLDGLMFNTEDLYGHVTTELLEERGHVFTNELKLEMMGLPGLQAVEIMRQRLGLRESAEELQQMIERGIHAQLAKHLQPMQGLLELLELLENKQLPKAIATSSSRRFADSVLRNSGLAQRFAFVLAGEDVENGKPHPEIYLTAADRLKVRTENLLVLEDSVNGSRAAAASGAITAAVPGVHSQSENFDHADFVFATLDEPELLHLINRSHWADRTS